MISKINNVQQLSEKDFPMVSKLSHEQEDMANAIYNNHIVFVNAKSGSGKSMCATQAGISLVKKGEVERLIYVANPIQTDTLGHLKGTLVDKTLPYYTPFFDALYSAGVSKIAYPMESISDPTIDTVYEATTPVFMRGINIRNSAVIIDEAQNFSTHDLMKIGTRIDDSCVLIIIGHTGQTDVPSDNSGFARYMNHFKRLKEAGSFKKVAFCELTHNYRGAISQAFDDLQ